MLAVVLCEWTLFLTWRDAQSLTVFENRVLRGRWKEQDCAHWRSSLRFLVVEMGREYGTHESRQNCPCATVSPRTERRIGAECRAPLVFNLGARWTLRVCPCWESNRDSSAAQAAAWLLYRLCYQEWERRGFDENPKERDNSKDLRVWGIILKTI